MTKTEYQEIKASVDLIDEELEFLDNLLNSNSGANYADVRKSINALRGRRKEYVNKLAELLK